MIKLVYDGLSGIDPKILSKKFEDLNIDDGPII